MGTRRPLMVTTGLVLHTLVVMSTAGCAEPVNYAAGARGASVTGPRNASGSAGQPNCANDGSLDYGYSHGFAWAYLDTPTIVTFAEPALIDAVEVLLHDLNGRTYSYRLSVAVGDDRQVVEDLSGERVRGYRLHRFPERRVEGLRLDFTDTSVAARSYHIVEVAAWRLGDATAGPLAERWRVERERRAAKARALLGVAPAQEALSEPAVWARAKAMQHGESFRHTLPDGVRAPVMRDRGRIVMAIDDDGNMPPDATGPDGVNDCLALDMNADGRIDRTIDYDDTTGDGIADRMVLTYADANTWGNRPFLVVIQDLDRKPRPPHLWKLHDYGYDQGICQWDCDFGGDGWFSMFARSPRDDRWVAAFEAPFCFYDLDGDGLAEETVRITATDTRLHSARYGINMDNDTTEGELYDYDLSITCLGRVELPPDTGVQFTHRSGEVAGPFLSWERTRDVVRAADWDRALLIWDENDHNTAHPPDRERWEGIINPAYRGVPQEGGPPTPRLNKRFELDADFSGRMQLYWWSADGRLHLLGAEQGSLEVDYNYDGVVDLAIEYADTSGDGRFDYRTITFPASGLPPVEIRGPRRHAPPGYEGPADAGVFPCSYEALAESWQTALPIWIAQAGELLEALGQAAERLGLTPYTAPMDFYHHATPEQFRFIERHRASREALRYYQDVTIELAFAHLLADAERAGVEGAVLQRLTSARRLFHAGRLVAAARRCALS